VKLPARDDRERRRDRHRFTATVEIDTVHVAGAHVTPIDDAERDVPLVAVIASRRSPRSMRPAVGPAASTSEKNQPLLVARMLQPGAYDAVVPENSVRREREEAAVHLADEEHEPKERRSAADHA
jgi:hypothetical protein